jgi:hypothetical protein
MNLGVHLFDRRFHQPRTILLDQGVEIDVHATPIAYLPAAKDQVSGMPLDAVWFSSPSCVFERSQLLKLITVGNSDPLQAAPAASAVMPATCKGTDARSGLAVGTHALASMIQLPKLTIGWPSQPNRSLISFRIRNVPL